MFSSYCRQANLVEESIVITTRPSYMEVSTYKWAQLLQAIGVGTGGGGQGGPGGLCPPPIF